MVERRRRLGKGLVRRSGAVRIFFGKWGWGRERCPSAKNTQTRFLTFDWRSENEHQEPSSRLR
ncbi:hypothetical protein, partial [Mesorhizobium silamurunense]|uniref:hypothetical protein n=1 Tax=Mesorhizobium silamurunense TaxID=499528 RepID=UPI001AEE841F